jgi:hypothetical protein
VIFTFCYRTTEGVFGSRLEAPGWEKAVEAAEELGGYALGPIISVIPAEDDTDHESWKAQRQEEHYPDPPPCPDHLRDRLVFANTWDERVALDRAQKAESALHYITQRNTALESLLREAAGLIPADTTDGWSAICAMPPLMRLRDRITAALASNAKAQPADA